MKTFIFSTRLDEKTAAKLKQLAEADGRSRGDIIRRLILAAKLPKATK